VFAIHTNDTDSLNQQSTAYNDSPSQQLNSSIKHDHLYCSSNNKIKLSCCFINVCGLVLKLLNPDVVNFSNGYDTGFFAETKLDEYDEIQVQCYTFRCINRTKCFQHLKGSVF